MKKRNCLKSLLILSILIFNVNNNFAVAADDFVEATQYSWGQIYSDDGFDQTFTIFKESDNFGVSEYGDDIKYTIEVQCSKKSLDVLLYSEPIGMYASSNLNRRGTARMKVDQGPIRNISYVVLSDSQGINFWNARSVSSAILKGRKTFSFKVPSSIQFDAVASFTVGDFSDYVSKFRKRGCRLS